MPASSQDPQTDTCVPVSTQEPHRDPLRQDPWLAVLAHGVVPAPFPLVSAAGAARPDAMHALPRFTAALGRVAPALRALRSRSALAAYATRTRRQQGVLDLGWLSPQPTPLFAPILPLRCPAGELSFTAFEAAFAVTWQQTQQRGSFSLDLYARAPALRRQRWPLGWPWALWISDTAPEASHAAHAGCVVWLSHDGATAHLLTSTGTPSSTAEALDAQLAALTQATLDTPELPTARLPLLDAAERERLLVTWNATAAPLPHATVHSLFEAQARRTPDAPALRFGTDCLSYAELDDRAKQWASRLTACGVNRQDRVALVVQRSLEMVVGLLAILKAGAAYIPVDCQQPPARIAALLARGRPRLILTHAAAHGLLPPDSIPRLCFDADTATPPQLAPGPAVQPDDLAYVIFTSGSTGEPKGVEICHRSVVNHSLFMARQYGLGPGDRLLCAASIGFDVAAEQIYPALFSGAEVVVRPDKLLETFQRFDGFVREQALTALTVPTAYWHEWVRDLEARQLTVPPSLRVLAVGTEKALGSALRSWHARGGKAVRFLQGYGPTEATITCTMYVHDDTREAFDPDAPLPIGRPLPNTEIYLLDEALEPVPVGLPGEIHIGGVGLARGYLGRDDLTAERFIPHPFRPDSSARLYKTGDIGRYLPDGQLVYIGRTDFQIKLRGFRMEPAEIEAVLRAHAGVQECLVMLREDTPGLPQLTAYLVAAPDAVDLSALQQHCRAHLPAPMQPSAYVLLRAFALNGNGKVDRAALPVPASSEPTADAADMQARSPLEHTVSALFAQVLGRPSMGLHDSFFDLGGSSLQAVRLLSCVEAQCAVSLALNDLLSNPTVASLAQCIATGAQAAVPSVIELKPGTGTPVFLVAGCPIYRALARAYQGPNPVYAVLLPVEDALLREGARLPPLAELAEAYLEALRAHTPRGPYALAGLSFGGVVAYEMAQRLTAQGEQVPLLALFDSILPRARHRNPLAWGRKRWTQAWARLRQALGQPVDTETLQTAQMDARRQHEIRRLLAEHDPQIQPYAGGHTVLYRAQDTRLGRGRAGHGFRGLVAGLIERDVPGDHLSMLGDECAFHVADDMADRLKLEPVTAALSPARM